MHGRRLALLLSLAAALLAFAGCGGAQNRPVVVATWPVQGADLAGTIEEVRFTFDEPVALLNPTQVAVNTGGVTIPLSSSEDPDDPHTLVLRPTLGEYWRVGETRITIYPGWEVNDAGHYRLESYRLVFQMGRALPVYFGVPSPASVVHTEGPDFVPVATIPTPGARTPVGLDCSAVGDEQRTWVQLAGGGGTGEALAWFEPGAAAMSPIPLTVEAGGDLAASREALRVDEDGAFLYAAFRDTALGRVRLHKVDVGTATEVASLVLSPASSATTSPFGLDLTPDGLQLHVACGGDAGARLVAVDLETFAEIDVGPDAGVDGLPLPAGPGPLGIGDTWTMIAPLAAAEAAVSAADLAALAVEELPSIVAGSPTSILLTPDRRYLVEGLSGWIDGEGASYRLLRDLDVEEPVLVDGVTGAGNGPATALLDLAWFTGSTRLIALLDNDAAVYLRFLQGGVEQEDLDETTPEAAVDLSGIAPGATLVAIPPPSVPVVP